MMDIISVWFTLFPYRFHDRHPNGGDSPKPLSFADTEGGEMARAANAARKKGERQFILLKTFW
jgi:hypothetical protein